jgi:FAD/FMN-containing dehydrogenase
MTAGGPPRIVSGNPVRRSGDMTTIETTALRDRMAGQVVTPADAGYDEARAIYNGMIDRRPAVIARCRSVDDVRTALDYGRRSGLAIAVRGGGH